MFSLNNNKLFRVAMLLVAAVVITASAGLVAGTAEAAPEPKVEICHIPPGNPANFHTITVSLNALSAHLAHGDVGGPCGGVCATLCDDQDPCTIDDIGDCETEGCPIPVPVDCDDDNPCTDDSCDSTSGCVNTELLCDSPDLCTLSTCAPDTGECVDSPVVCPDGYTCDLATGDCAAAGPPGDPCESVMCSDGFTCIDGECIEGSAKNLLGPDTGSCDGEGAGYTTVVDLGEDGLRVDVEFSNGPANTSSTVYWICTHVPGGCHGSACGFIRLGTITTDSNGNGFLSTVLPDGNPFPGKYVHFDVGGPPWFTSITSQEIFPAIGK